MHGHKSDLRLSDLRLSTPTGFDMAKTSDTVELDVTNGVAIVSIDNPPVNALSKSVRDGLYEAVVKSDGDESVTAILIICKGRTYIAGADIREFGQPPSGTPLFDVHNVIENASKPVISAIHGTALGGGLETALCCHFRLAVDSARFGLPEVHLGLLPGAGGTQRLPRIVGVQESLQMMTSGEMVNADFALDCGLIDEIVDDLLEGGLAFAEEGRGRGSPARQSARTWTTRSRKQGRTRSCLIGFANRSPARHVASRHLKPSSSAWKMRWPRHTTSVFRKNASASRNSISGEKSAAQRYYFFAERQANKIPGVSRDTPKIPIAKVGMIGAGTMGGGISMNFLNAGIPVTIVESKHRSTRSRLERHQERTTTGRRSEEVFRLPTSTGVWRDLHPPCRWKILADCDLVIEAVYENLDLKKEIIEKTRRYRQRRGHSCDQYLGARCQCDCRHDAAARSRVWARTSLAPRTS